MKLEGEAEKETRRIYTEDRVVCPARAGKRENRNERRERTRVRGLNLERRGRFSGDAP